MAYTSLPPKRAVCFKSTMGMLNLMVLVLILKSMSLRLMFLLGVVTLLISCSRESPRVQTNFIIVLVDDMGFSDLGSYGGEIQTPNLDTLAFDGVRFTQFYNTSRCCPTRASLLTGLYPHQAGMGQMTGDKGLPGYEGQLKKNAITIAEALKLKGYQTGMVGKWHVSRTKAQQGGANGENQLAWLNHQGFLDSDFGELDAYPTARGFDKYYGNIWGVVDFFDPFSLVNGDKPVPSVPDGYYHTDALSDSAVAYVEQFSKNDNPFFLYIAHTAPHWPLHALPADIEKYEDIYTQGWDKIRKARYDKMKALGLFEKMPALSPEMRAVKNWDSLENQAYHARKMAVHAAMIDRVDQGMARLIEKLKETGQYDNTVIFFLSDNGASPETPAKAGFDRNSQARDGREVIYTRNDQSVLPGSQTTYAGIGRDWANVSNTPFRYWKARTFEGGICTPLVVHWPLGITGQTGKISSEPGHVIDLMATCLDIAGVEQPKTFNGEETIAIEGKSLVPALKTGNREGHSSIFFEHFYSRAIRVGDWKLVSLPLGEWELYNLAEDRTEMHNLASENPSKLEELKAVYEKEANRTMVYPQPRVPERMKNNTN